MGKIKQGLLGPLSGKVGNVIGASWRGINYLRIVPANVNDPKTEAQVNQRSKFVVVLRFIQPLLSFIRLGFRSFASRMSAYNAAMSYNLKNAVTGDFPLMQIDYSRAAVSRGNLRDVPSVDAVSTEPRTLLVTWEDNSGIGNAREDDQAMVVVFNQERMDVYYRLRVATRADGMVELILPEAYSGDTVHVYLAFTTEGDYFNPGDRNTISNSVYAGNVVVA